MNTLDINNKLKHVNGFLGAFPYDELPKTRKMFYSMIINTEPSNEAGDHWLALVFRDKQFWFLDSFGRDYNNFMFDDGFKQTMNDYISDRSCFYNDNIFAFD